MNNGRIINIIGDMLRGKDIKFEVKDKKILIPYIVGKDKVLVVIAVFFDHDKIVCIAFYENKLSDVYRICSELNSKTQTPKLYVFKDDMKHIISECYYDLKIFPDKYIGEWFFSAIDAHLAAFKEIYNIKPTI